MNGRRIQYFLMLLRDDDIAVVFDDTGFPLFGVAWLGDAFWDVVSVAVGYKTAVRVLSLHVAVNVFDKQKLLKLDPFPEYLLGIVD